MKLTSITWGSDVPLLAEACAKLGIALSAWTPRDLEDEWSANLHGLCSTEIGWSVAMPEFEGAIKAIVWNSRLRRILMGIAAGVGLAVAGATMQGILKNPLASPYTLGIASAPHLDFHTRGSNHKVYAT